jgi:hypothetical protein
MLLTQYWFTPSLIDCLSQEFALWCAESARPFAIVKDQCLLNLLKTGRPEYPIPSPTTISRDVQRIFEHTKARLATILQVNLPFQYTRLSLTYLTQNYDGDLSFATDAWTSPNHRAYVAFTVHFIHEGTPISLPLDFIEVATVRTSIIASIILPHPLPVPLFSHRLTPVPISPMRLPLFSRTILSLIRYVQYLELNHITYPILVVGCHSRQCICQRHND